MANLYEPQNLAYVFRRSINSRKIFKGEVRCSCKEDSFQIIIKNNQILQEENLKQKINTLYIVEGAIDACAIATLLKIKNKLIEPLQIITTAGHPNRFLKNRIDKINPQKIIIATDMDIQGRNFAQIIKTMIGNRAFSIPTYLLKITIISSVRPFFYLFYIIRCRLLDDGNLVGFRKLDRLLKFQYVNSLDELDLIYLQLPLLACPHSDCGRKGFLKNTILYINI